MRVLVIGATGRTGQHAMAQLLARGDVVAAFARKPAAVTAKGELLSVFEGDVRDSSAVERAVRNQDAVLAAFGPSSSGRSELLTYAMYNDDVSETMMRTLIAAMRMYGVKRLVNLSSWALEPALLNFANRRIIIPLLAGRVLADKRRGELLLQASGLDYVNVRPGQLMNSSARGGVKASPDGRGLKQIIARQDLAAFMIEQLTDNSWIRKAVYVGY